MLRLLRERALHLVLVLFIVSLVATLLLDLVPGDPAYALLGPEITPEVVEQVHEELGLDKPFYERYVNWLGNAVQGDFGESFRTKQPVLDEVRQRLPVTLEIGLMALIASILIALPIGIYSAYRSDRIFDRISGVGSSILISAPQFLTGLLLVYFLSVQNQVFPVAGWVPLSDDVGENLRHAFLPALTLALAEIPVFTRLIRADMLATLQEPYILTAASKGLPIRRILLRHALRPSSFSLMTLAGISLGRLIGGTVVVEVIFGLPGVGSLVVNAISVKDLTMVVGVVAIVAIAYVVINTLVDLAYAYLDPRLRART